ncbi:hypothetical protein H4582DRAFT_2016854 [Lactarius indigo]|nr:hypothetical protein H4582DRAFT_2016854 [Lactarius indigo]
MARPVCCCYVLSYVCLTFRRLICLVVTFLLDKGQSEFVGCSLQQSPRQSRNPTMHKDMDRMLQQHGCYVTRGLYFSSTKCQQVLLPTRVTVIVHYGR